jgi:hypothetical protein
MYQILANDPPLTLASKRQYHMHFKLTDILEWLGQDIKRRTRVVRNFPNAESRLRLAKNSVITTVAAACCSALPGHVGQICHVGNVGWEPLCESRQ